MSSTMTNTEQLRILLVDDEELLRRVFARALSREGHTVAEASNGRQAVVLLGDAKFDVVISDIRMPDMGGIELLRAVRERDLDLPVILVTGSPDVASATAAVELGALKYMTKPIDIEQLVKEVAHAGKLHRLANAKREALAMAGDGAGQLGDRAGLEASFGRFLSTLWMAYQPIVRVSDKTIYGFETLLRSNEPSLPHPGAVLEAAERLGRLRDLGRTTRAASVAPMASAPEGSLLFVNLHTLDLLDEDLYARDAPLSSIANRVVLEITERRSLDEVGDSVRRIARLRELGFRLAIDDLGAGYAGLTSFAVIEPEIVKLDMSLVRGVDSSTTKQKLVKSMTTLCRDMGMLIVAEGVETAQERDALIDLKCDLLQGYLFAKPGRPFPASAW